MSIFTTHSVQFSCSVVSDSLRSHELQHASPPCPSPTPGVYPNLCPLSRWCHPAISSSVIPFSSCPKSFPALGSFPMSQLFPWVGQSTGVSASTSVLPMNTQDWSPLGWTGWISLQSKGLSSLLQHHSSKASIFLCSAFFPVQLSHPYMSGKTIALTRRTFVGKVVSLLLNMLSRLVITFLPRSKGLLISWLQLPPAVILEPQKIKSDIDNSKPVFFNWVPHFNKRREIIKYSLNFPKNGYINSTISCLGKLIYYQQQISWWNVFHTVSTNSSISITWELVRNENS